MEYTLKQTIESPGYIIRVHTPVIDEGKRNRRMKAIRKASEKLILESIKHKEKGEKK